MMRIAAAGCSNANAGAPDAVAAAVAAANAQHRWVNR